MFWFSMVFFRNFGSCGLDLKERDLLKRLEILGKSWSTWESKDMAIIYFHLIRNLAYTLPILPSNISSKFTQILSHLSVLTTLVADSNPYFLLDQELESLYFYCNNPLIFKIHCSIMCCISRGDQMDVALVISNKICRNQEEIDLYVKQYLVESLDEHYNLCMEKCKN
jgi:hypothetical protein